MRLLAIKSALRNGKYAWPGGYPMFFVTSDSAVLSFDSVHENWREVVSAHLTRRTQCGWHIAGVDTNWEDPDLYCDHSGKRIESAYAEDDAKPA